MMCGLDIESLLVGSHTKPWHVSSDFEKLDVYNGLLLCNCHDPLFDKGYISFRDSGEILISNKLHPKNYSLLNIATDITIEIDEKSKKYLKYHRDNIFRK